MTAYDSRPTDDVLEEVSVERQRQHSKWGQQNHGNEVWLAVLTEEVGESAQALLRLRAASQPGTPETIGTLGHLREEVIQTAAVAVAWVEYIDRWRTPARDERAKGPQPATARDPEPDWTHRVVAADLIRRKATASVALDNDPSTGTHFYGDDHDHAEPL